LPVSFSCFYGECGGHNHQYNGIVNIFFTSLYPLNKIKNQPLNPQIADQIPMHFVKGISPIQLCCNQGPISFSGKSAEKPAKTKYCSKHMENILESEI
jgi:hypothetical protein